MAGLALLWPSPLAALAVSSGESTKALLSTPSPREAWTSVAGTVHTIDVDLGTAKAVDLAYLGNTNLPVGTTLALSSGTALGAGLSLETTVAARLPLSTGTRCSCVIERPSGSPVARFFRIEIVCPAAQLVEVGNLCIGPAFRHAYAFQSGRQLIDTGRRADLSDGGFGLSAGVTKAAFKWRFVDLTEPEAEYLWQRVRERGTRAPVVAIEKLDGPPPEPCVHYGLFDRFEAWERANAIDTVWAFSMTEWR